MDERETIETVQSVEVQPNPQEIELVPDADMAASAEAVEQPESVLADNPEIPVETAVEDSAVSAETSGAVDAERVEKIVDALLQSEQVTDLIQSFEDTLQTVASAATMTPVEAVPPMTVVSVEEVLDRLEERTAAKATVETPQTDRATATVKAAPTVTANAGEILVPGETELTVIEVVQAILEYFQSDDNDLLTGIRDNTADIKNTVTEIKTAVVHPMMETPFADYSVTEGLLLVLVLWLVILNPCIRMIKGGFSWLLS